MPRDPNRTRRIESEIQRTVSELLRREVKDPRVGSVTITAVQVSPDLGHARVFYLPFDHNRDAEEIQAGLNGVARFLRGKVGRNLKLRVAPELHFQPDEQLAQGMRLSEIIDNAVKQDERRHVGEADPSKRDSRTSE
jgi:ribosome-binding factor A